MSELDNLINYLKIARRSKELAESNTKVIANILDGNSITMVESIEKTDLNNPQLYRALDEELEFHSMLFLSTENNERIYYKKYLIYNPLGEPIIKYRKLFDTTLLVLPDTNFIRIKIESKQGYYYDTTNNTVIELYLEEQVPLSDWCEYHPADLSGITVGEHQFDYKDEKGNNTAWDIAFSPIFKDYRLNRRKVDFSKKLIPGFLYLYPLIKKESSESYVLNYYYRKKGDLIHFLDEDSTPAITLRFSYIGACLAFLNHTIFYFMDTDDGFETAIRKKFFNQYKKIVYDELNSLQNLPLYETLEILYFIPRGLLSIISKEFLWSTVEKAIDGILTNVDTDTEDIILTILKALSNQETADEFLNKFLKARRGKNTLFALIYEKMNGTNFVKLVKLFRQIWLSSSYIDISNKSFSKSDGPLLLPYKSDKFIGFFGSNKNFDFLSNDYIQVTADDHWIDEVGNVIHDDIGDGLNELFEDQIKFKYHPFQPIYLTEVIKESPLELPKLLPAFFLKANEDKAFWSNVITTIEYTTDIVTTLSGVGNLAKFRYLARISQLAEVVEGANAVTKIARATNILRYVKGAAGVIEITSGSVNLMLKITGAKDTELGESLSKVLFYLELITLAGELTASMKLGIQKSAKEAIEASDRVLRMKHPELFAELYKIVKIDSKLLFKNKEFLKHLEDLKYGRVARVYPKLLSLEEEAVLKFYTTNAGYKNFNKALRGEIEMTDEFLAQEQLMNQALDKLPNYKTDALLYRIENLTDAQIKEYYKVGEEISNKHFTSSSYDMFSIGEAMRKRKFTVLIRLETKTGKLIEPVSTFKDEGEVLFKSNTSFYVDKFTENINPSDPFGSKIKTIIIKEK